MSGKVSARFGGSGRDDSGEMWSDEEDDEVEDETEVRLLSR